MTAFATPHPGLTVEAFSQRSAGTARIFTHARHEGTMFSVRCSYLQSPLHPKGRAMTIRRRSLITIFVTTIVLVAVLYVISRLIILDGFSEVEASMIKRDVARVMSALQFEMSSLRDAARQWSGSGGRTGEICNRQKSAVPGRLTDRFLTNLRLDAILILDPAGTHAKGAVPENTEKPLRTTLAELRKIFLANASLTKNPGSSRVLTGVLLLKDGPFMFASRPVPQGNDKGASANTLILGRYLDSERARRLSNLLRMQVLFRSPNAPLPGPIPGSLDLKHAGPIAVRILDDQVAEGFGLVLDPFGQPALVVEVKSKRNLYRVGQATAYYFLFCLAMVGIIFGAVSWETLEIGILVPLTRLIKDVSAIAERRTSSDRVTSQGNDEMAQLASAINSMLEALEGSKQALVEARRLLEQKVLERTAQLTEMNEKLTEEIEARKRVQEDLRAGEARYRAVVDNQTELICRFSPDYRLTFVNDAYCRYFDAEPEDLLGKAMPPAAEGSRDEGTTFHVSLPTKDNPLITCEKEVILNNGERRRQQWSDQAIFDERGEIVEFQSVGRDITELEASAREKECLVQEIHHRVKNNLQIMMSLLDLQSEYVRDPKSLEVFRDAENRILSMALVHEHLYQSESFAEVRAQDYLQELIEELLFTYEDVGSHTAVSVNARDISFGVETAVPLGLIVSELASNSLKHAFSNAIAGEIRISLESLGNDEFELQVSDNGVGFSTGSSGNQQESFGLYLVRTLVEQLHGEMHIDASEGAAFLIRFQRIRPKRGGRSDG